MSDILDTKSNTELLQSIIAEVAKANNEISCAQRDVKKAQSRMNFLVVLANKLIERDQIK
jgi:hypothetical protein